MDETPRVKLKRLKINRYRTIKPGTELHFSDGMNVLLGKNGSGKTTLLNLLAMVVSGNFYEARGEEFSVEFDIESGRNRSTWFIKLANEKRPSPHDKNTQKTLPLIATCQYAYLPNGSDPYQSFKIYSPKFPFGEPFNEYGYNFINTEIAELDVEGELPSYLPESIPRLDEARDWLLRSLKSDIPSIIFRRRGIASSRENPFLPIDVFQKFLDIFTSNKETISMVSDSQSIPSLQRIVAALGYAKGQVILEQLSADKERILFGSPRFHFTKLDGTSVQLDQLSFGEQRLFAFYYYLACTWDVVIADELTNGLHHEMISGCIAAIGDRQAFLATQNPLLLDHLEFKSIAEVRASFILCSKDTSDGQEWMAMRQPGEDEGREFFGHYQVEQKQVNAILRWLGLW